jgi:hypothetical protein
LVHQWALHPLKKSVCPEEKCNRRVTAEALQSVYSTLDQLHLYRPQIQQNPTTEQSTTIVLNVSTLDGTTLTVQARTDTRVLELKETLSKKLKEKTTKLRLSFGIDDMKVI